jgi:hypothetical protein
MKFPTDKFNVYWRFSDGEDSTSLNAPSLRKLERIILAADANIQHLSRFWKEIKLAPKQNIQDVCEES